MKTETESEKESVVLPLKKQDVILLLENGDHVEVNSTSGVEIVKESGFLCLRCDGDVLYFNPDHVISVEVRDAK